MRLLLLLIFALMGLAGAQGPASPLRLVTSEGVVTAFRGPPRCELRRGG